MYACHSLVQQFSLSDRILYTWAVTMRTDLNNQSFDYPSPTTVIGGDFGNGENWLGLMNYLHCNRSGVSIRDVSMHLLLHKPDCYVDCEALPFESSTFFKAWIDCHAPTSNPICAAESDITRSLLLDQSAQEHLITPVLEQGTCLIAQSHVPIVHIYEWGGGIGFIICPQYFSICENGKLEGLDETLENARKVNLDLKVPLIDTREKPHPTSALNWNLAASLHRGWAVGDAILGLTPWDSPPDDLELHQLFGENKKARCNVVQKAKSLLHRQLLHCFVNIMEMAAQKKNQNWNLPYVERHES